MNILHGIAALLFALLLELFAGNWYVVIPFSCCVLNRVTARFPLPWLFLCGFLTGLVLDLIYWRTYPGSALATALTVLAVRVLTEKSKITNALLKALFTGALTGVFSVFLMALFTGYADSGRLPAGCHIITSFAGAMIFQLLISPGKSLTPERSAGPSERKKESQGSSSNRKTPRSAPPSKAPRSSGKKQK